MTTSIYVIYGTQPSAVLPMVPRNHPIHAVFPFISIFSASPILFTPLHADFIGPIILMIHAGVVAVPFPFVVTMLHIRKIEHDNTTYSLIGGFLILLFPPQSISAIVSPDATHPVSNIEFDDTLSISESMRNDESSTVNIVHVIGYESFIRYPIVPSFPGITPLVSPIGSVYSTNTKYGSSSHMRENKAARNNRSSNVH